MRMRGQVANDLSSAGTAIVSEPFLMVCIENDRLGQRLSHSLRRASRCRV